VTVADSYTIGAERTADGAATVLRLSGELDINARDDLHEALLLAVTDGDVVVDLDAVSFLDSEALGALIDGYNMSRERYVRFRVINPHDVVDRVLSVSGAKDLFDS
jgi:anti-anti-sigma factor